MDQMRHEEPLGVAEPSVEGRTGFQRALDHLGAQLRDMEILARDQLERSLQALTANDLEACQSVVEGDDDIDRRYAAIETAVAGVIARQQPVATDLRLLIALDHAALHIERIGDEAVNIAEAVMAAATLEATPGIVHRLQEMGETVLQMSGLAVQAFTTRDTARCDEVVRLDERVDASDRLVLDELVSVGRDDEVLEWAMRMSRVSRHLERAADHAVDVAEQAWYVATGEIRELD
jgi:phosphate transport system protein